MKIEVAKTAGFCFGVNRALKIVYNLLEYRESVCTLGPIIHNSQLVEELGKKGVRIVEDYKDVKNNEVLVIRSHGVGDNITEQLNKLNLNYEDATCPFVKKIHKIVKEQSQNGRKILIAGDPKHPEVKGIVGCCKGDYLVFNSEKELNKIFDENENLKNIGICVVAQTTFDIKEWEICLKIVKKLCTNSLIFDTICNATSERQTEAIELSKKSDLMIVIGGLHSSNTSKLKTVCEKYCNKTFLIETYEQLPVSDIKKAKFIGVTAGASTPAKIIKEVLEVMSDILENKENIESVNAEEEQNFEQMLEESFKNFNTDQKVRGVVVGMTPNEVYVDIGRKHSGFIPANELTDDSNAKVEDLVKVGDELDLLIMRTNDQEGTIMLSKKRIDRIKGREEILEAFDKKTVVEGKVKKVVKGGVIALANGVNVFIPASQATAFKGDSLEELVGKDVKFHIIELDMKRNRIIGSIRSVLREEKKLLADKFWETVEIGKKYTGIVRSITNYGAFVDIGGLDGMIHISELSWSRVKHPSDIINVGDTVEVYIKDLDEEKRKISLGYKKQEDNPWEILKNNYQVDSVVDVTIVSLTSFGAFARILPGVDGLIHISQISDHRIDTPSSELKVGDEVKAKIIGIDVENKRVSLSIRKLLEKQKESEYKENAENFEEN